MRVAMATDTWRPAMNGIVRSLDVTCAALDEIGVATRIVSPGRVSVPSFVYPDLRVSLAPVTRRSLRADDVVHVHTPGPVGLGAARAGRAAGARVVVTHHTRLDEAIAHFAPRPLRRPLAALNDAVHRRFLARANAVVAPTPAIAEELARRYRVRAEVVPTGLSPQYQAEARAAAKLRQPGGAPRVLYLGRLAPEKELDVLLRAFAVLRRGAPDATLVMAGVGPDAARLRALAASLGVASRVAWLGFVPEADLARVYASADAFVSPSTYETQGLTVLEAMAAGAPVACPDLDVFRELTKAGAVEPFAPGDAEGAADAIVRCLATRPARAAAAQRIVERSTADASAARLLKLYAD